MGRLIREKLSIQVDVWQFAYYNPQNKTYYFHPVQAQCGSYRDSIPLCRGARGTIAVAHTGELSPCNQMAGLCASMGVSLGNVKKQSLHELLSESRYLDMVTTPVGAVKERNPECQSCQYWPACMGGCRAIATALTKDMLHADPSKCAFFKGGYMKKIDDVFTGADPEYDEDKPWNKNMVARILENRKYTGGSGFPAVIPPEAYQKAQAQRKERAAPPTKTPARKELRRLCGGNPPKYVEGQVLGVLNRLAANPSLISALPPPEDDPVQIRVLHRKLTDLLKEAPVDEAAARRTALDLAAQRLDAIGSEEYETERLRRVFEKAAPMESLDAELLHSCVQAITIQKRRAIVQLKNGQTVE